MLYRMLIYVSATRPQSYTPAAEKAAEVKHREPSQRLAASQPSAPTPYVSSASDPNAAFDFQHEFELLLQDFQGPNETSPSISQPSSDKRQPRLTMVMDHSASNSQNDYQEASTSYTPARRVRTPSVSYI